ncbi:hypothetical protein [Nonomuraea candida]|nr:hypothetical protein [Nonomuraea candida]
MPSPLGLTHRANDLRLLHLGPRALSDGLAGYGAAAIRAPLTAA